MKLDGHVFKAQDKILYRGWVAEYEGDITECFVIYPEYDTNSVYGFPGSIADVFEQINDEFNDDFEDYNVDHSYEIIVF